MQCLILFLTASSICLQAGPARTALEECEAAAKKAHRGIFEYGDGAAAEEDV